MVKDQDLINIFGGDADAVWLAPLGSTLPTGLDTPDAAFVEVGYLGSDGLEHNRDTNVERFPAHQGAKIVRAKITEFTREIVFRALENNDLVRGIVDKVESSTTVGEVTTEVLSDSGHMWIGAMVVDLYDSGYMERYVFSRVEIAPGGTETWSNSALREWELTATVVSKPTRLSGPVPVAAPVTP